MLKRRGVLFNLQSSENIRTKIKSCISSVADPGCLYRISDTKFSIPDSWSMKKIPDPDPHKSIYIFLTQKIVRCSRKYDFIADPGSGFFHPGSSGQKSTRKLLIFYSKETVQFNVFTGRGKKVFFCIYSLSHCLWMRKFKKFSVSDFFLQMNRLRLGTSLLLFCQCSFLRECTNYCTLFFNRY